MIMELETGQTPMASKPIPKPTFATPMAGWPACTQDLDPETRTGSIQVRYNQLLGQHELSFANLVFPRSPVAIRAVPISKLTAQVSPAGRPV